MVVINTETMIKGMKALATVPAPYVGDVTNLIAEFIACLEVQEGYRDRLLEKLRKYEEKADKELEEFEKDLEGR